MTWVNAAVALSGGAPSGTAVPGGAAGIDQAELDALTVHTSGFVNVKDFGAVGDGVVDDTAAVQAAITSAGGGRVFFPPGTYRITGSLTLPAGTVLIGASKYITTIKRFSTSALIPSFTGRCSIQNLTLDGNGATYVTGVGITCPTNNGFQTIINTDVVNWPASALEFAQDGGTEFTSVASTFHTLGTMGSVAAVKVLATDTQAIPRKFFGPASNGCTLFDFGGASDFFASSFYTNGLIYGATGSKVMVENVRIGAAGGTVTVNGDDNILRGVSAASIVVASGSTGNILEIQAPSWDITDSGSGNSILMVNRAHTPTWTATGGGSTSVGTTGTLTALYSRKGKQIRMEMDMTLNGTGILLGTSGAWEFSLPDAARAASPTQACGQAICTLGASTFVGVVRVAAGTSVCRIYTNSGAVGPTIPGAWVATDNLRLVLEYTVD